MILFNAGLQTQQIGLRMPLISKTDEDNWVTPLDEEIPGPWKNLARLARQTTGKVSSRVAARRGQISHDTVLRLWEGDRISVTKLIAFARGYEIDPKPLLVAADYPVFLGEESTTPSLSSADTALSQKIYEFADQLMALEKRLHERDSQIQELLNENASLKEQLEAAAKSGPIINNDGEELNPDLRKFSAEFIDLLVSTSGATFELFEHVLERRLTLTALMQWERQADSWVREGRAAVDREIAAKRAANPTSQRDRPDSTADRDPVIVEVDGGLLIT